VTDVVQDLQLSVLIRFDADCCVSKGRREREYDIQDTVVYKVGNIGQVHVRQRGGFCLGRTESHRRRLILVQSPSAVLVRS